MKSLRTGLIALVAVFGISGSVGAVTITQGVNTTFVSMEAADLTNDSLTVLIPDGVLTPLTLPQFVNIDRSFDGPTGTAIADLYAFTVELPANGHITLTPDFSNGFEFTALILQFDDITPAITVTDLTSPFTIAIVDASATPDFLAVTVQGTSTGVAGTSYILDIELSAVPVPGAVILFGSAIASLFGFGVVRRRRSEAAA